MLHASMATKKTAVKKPATKGATKTPEKLSLAEIGRRAAKDAQRKALLDALVANDWNLTRTAEALLVHGTGNLIRMLKDLAPDEYEAAKADGRISPANRRE